MLIDLAKMAKLHKFCLANSLLDSPMATWLPITGACSLIGQALLSPKISIHSAKNRTLSPGIMVTSPLRSLFRPRIWAV